MPGNVINLTPADVAEWPAPNYENPERRGWLPACAIVWFAAGTVLLGTRYWLRMRGHAGRLGLDDAVMLPGWVGGLMFTIVIIVYTIWAQGDRHIWDVLPTKREDITLCLWLAELSFVICGGCTKVSVLLFYRRLVDGTYSRRWKYAILVAIAFTIAYTLAFSIVLFTSCRPTRAYWKAFDAEYAASEEYTCIDTRILNAFAGVFISVSDLYAVVLPCILTWHFNVPRAQRIALSLIFSLGLLVVAASSVRTYYFFQIGYNSDVSWITFDVHVWAQIELQLGIMCASAPALRGFFRRYFGATTISSGPKVQDARLIRVVRHIWVTVKDAASSSVASEDGSIAKDGQRDTYELYALGGYSCRASGV